MAKRELAYIIKKHLLKRVIMKFVHAKQVYAHIDLIIDIFVERGITKSNAG